MVEMCKSADQIDSFCRNTCIRLECCPNLISTQLVIDTCPDDCSNLTKSKYCKSSYNGSNLINPDLNGSNFKFKYFQAFYFRLETYGMKFFIEIT